MSEMDKECGCDGDSRCDCFEKLTAKISVLKAENEQLKTKDQVRTQAETDWGFQEQARQDRTALKIKALEAERDRLNNLAVEWHLKHDRLKAELEKRDKLAEDCINGECNHEDLTKCSIDLNHRLLKQRDLWKSKAERYEEALKEFTEIHDVPEYGHSCVKGACMACKVKETLAAEQGD
jgi:hypothetical protein